MKVGRLITLVLVISVAFGGVTCAAEKKIVKQKLVECVAPLTSNFVIFVQAGNKCIVEPRRKFAEGREWITFVNYTGHDVTLEIDEDTVVDSYDGVVKSGMALTLKVVEHSGEVKEFEYKWAADCRDPSYPGPWIMLP